MARYKNIDWNLGDLGPDGSPTWNLLQCALLMDIRDELQELNRLFHCPNFRDLPSAVFDIRRATGKRKRAKKSAP